MGSPVYILDAAEKQATELTVREKLTELHIDFNLYQPEVKAIYKVGAGIGFEFNCINWRGLMERLEKHQDFIRDDENTLLGCFMAAKTRGTGYRQKGPTKSVHFQIDRNWCDVHIDSHGVVNNMGQYSLIGMMSHLPWDLMPFMTRNHGYVQIGPNVLVAPTLGFSPSVITRLQRFYDGGFKGGLPSLKEVGEGVQVGYDIQIMGHTRVGGVLSFDNSYLLKTKPSLAFDTIGKFGRFSTQLSPDDVSVKGEVYFSPHLKAEGEFSKTFDSAEKGYVQVMVLYQVGSQ